MINISSVRARVPGFVKGVETQSSGFIVESVEGITKITRGMIYAHVKKRVPGVLVSKIFADFRGVYVHAEEQVKPVKLKINLTAFFGREVTSSRGWEKKGWMVSFGDDTVIFEDAGILIDLLSKYTDNKILSTDYKNSIYCEVEDDT